MSKASSLEESQKRINKALNEYQMIKKRDLWGKLAQEHIDRMVSICLTKRYEEEFDCEWSKVFAAEFTLLGAPWKWTGWRRMRMSLIWTVVLVS